MTDSLQFGSCVIEYTLAFTARKTLGITVTPEMDVIVKAPQDTPLEKIRQHVKMKAPWIIKQLSFFLSFHPKTPTRKYVSGETHLYMGRQYQLKVTLSKKNEVKYQGRFIEVFTAEKENAEILLTRWYKKRAEIKFTEIAEPLVEKFKKYNVVPKGIYIREMPRRWGSCTAKGKVILNPELIKAPRPCIEYVIIHELCHLIHHDHTNRFFELQSKEMPDWRRWKDALEKLLA